MKAISLSILFACASVANAETVKVPMSPGLWEVKSTMVSDDPKVAQAMAQAQKAMENLPPEQKKMMQDMMKKQGVSMDMQGGAVNVTMCLTQAMIDSNQALGQQNAGCEPKLEKLSESSFRFSYSCANSGSGEGTYAFDGKNAYTFDMKINTGGAKPQKMSMSGSGKLLDSDCGDVKPFAMPK